MDIRIPGLSGSRNMLNLQKFAALIAVNFIIQLPAWAQTSDYSKEYQYKIQAGGTISMDAATPFGEMIDLNTGATGFRQVDLVLNGIGPSIVISRKSISGDLSAVNPLMFSGMGDWRLEVPEIVTLVPGKTKVSSVSGIWKTFSPSGSTFSRCTYFGEMWEPGPGYAGLKTGGIESFFWWQGYSLEIPGGGSQTILKRTGAPAPVSGLYPAVTNSHWQIGCLPETSNGEPGEGFLAVSPDGTKYYLTHLTYDSYQSFMRNEPGDDWVMSIPRNIARMKATRVEDRNGNYIEYHYTGDKLTSITASDGRQVSIQWYSDSPLIQSISANGRTWNYFYSSRLATGGTLSTVQLPDGSTWIFSGSAAPTAYAPVVLRGCLSSTNAFSAYPSDSAGVDKVYTMMSPSGLIGIFRYSARLRAQSYVPSICDTTNMFGGGGDSDSIFFMTSALVQKEISGPGLPSRTWNFVYEIAKPSVDRNCTVVPCQSTTYTDVFSPDGSRKRYLHITRVGALQGKLVREETYSGDVLKASVEYYYNYTEADRPSPGTYGDAMRTATPLYNAENLVVTRKVVNNLQGRAFVWEVPASCGAEVSAYCLDIFGRPTKVIKSSTP